jgi:hypothetical protein
VKTTCELINALQVGNALHLSAVSEVAFNVCYIKAIACSS